MPLYDNHNHCQFSFDGKSTCVEATAREASRKGLGGICFTDHYDILLPKVKALYEETVPETFDIPSQQKEIDRVQALLREEGSPLRIFKGMELGVCREAREDIAKVLDENSFDEVIASVHYLDDTDPYWGPYYEGKSWKEAYSHYLEVLLEEMRWLGDRFDIMGHFDYIVRYAPYPEASIMWKDFPDLLDEILLFLAENGKALEVNTKTYQMYRGRTPLLDPAILERFREKGGEFISLGSDSHRAEGVAFNFEKTARWLFGQGCRWEVHYEGRKPIVTALG